jgi:hypothetical protein
VLKVRKVILAFKVYKVQQLKVHQVRLPMVLQVLRVHKGYRVQLDHKVLKVLREHQWPVLKVHKEQQVQLDHKAYQVLLVHKDHKVSKALKDLLVLLVFRVLKVL